MIAGFAHAEFDDDTRIEVGNFSLNLGWGLPYTPESLDSGKSIFPLLAFVEENYDSLKNLDRQYMAEISKGKDSGRPYKLMLWNNVDEDFKTWNLLTESQCVDTLISELSECILKHGAKQKESLTLYLVAMKSNYKSNVPDWNGEFSRHSLSCNMTKDGYLFAFYFSREKAEEKALQNPSSILRKVVCTKETANKTDFSYETKLEKLLKDSCFLPMQKVVLTSYHFEIQKDGSDDFSKADITCALVYKDSSFVEMWRKETLGDEHFQRNYGARLKVTGSDKCDFICVKNDGTEQIRYSIQFVGKNTVRVTDPCIKDSFDFYRTEYGSKDEYEPDFFVLEEESYKKLKTDLLEKRSLESAVSFFSNSLYFWNESMFYELLAPLGETYRIKNSVCRFSGSCGTFWVLHILYHYKNGVLSSLVAEDKGDFGGTTYKKTLVSDDQNERIYSSTIDGFYENWGDTTEKFDKRTLVLKTESETMNNHFWKESMKKFPPKTMYFSEKEMQVFLSGK